MYIRGDTKVLQQKLHELLPLSQRFGRVPLVVLERRAFCLANGGEAARDRCDQVLYHCLRYRMPYPAKYSNQSIGGTHSRALQLRLNPTPDILYGVEVGRGRRPVSWWDTVDAVLYNPANGRLRGVRGGAVLLQQPVAIRIPLLRGGQQCVCQYLLVSGSS